MIQHPHFSVIANVDGYAAVGIIQTPKYRSGGTDTLSRTGVIFGSPLFVPPPMTAAPRSQTISFAGQ